MPNVVAAMASVVAISVIPVTMLAVVMDALVVTVTMGVVGVQFARVGVSSHGSRIHSRREGRQATNNRTTLTRYSEPCDAWF